MKGHTVNDRQLLCFCIVLIIHEKVLGLKNVSYDLSKNILTITKQPEVNLEVNPERFAINSLRQTLEYITNTTTLDSDIVLPRLQIDCSDFPSHIEMFKSALVTTLTDEDRYRKIHNIKKMITDHIKSKDVENTINELSYKLKFKRQELGNAQEIASFLVDKLKKYTVGPINNITEGIISELDTNDIDKTIEICNETAKLIASVDTYTLGLQGLNRMLQDKVIRGKFYIIGALPHQSKSFFVTDILMQIMMYNKPVNPTPGKKPLILLISTEDSNEERIQSIYSCLYLNTFHKEVKEPKSLDPKLMANFISNSIKGYGWHFKAIHVNPTTWGYQDYFNKIEEYEQDNYELFFVGIDYAGMMSTKGCDGNGSMGSDVRDLIRRLRNHAIENNYGLFSPHQLSQDAKQLIRNGANTESFVQELPGKGYYDKCGRLDQEVDIEIFIHICKLNGKFYITIQRGKHRGLFRQTPEEDKFCVYQLSEHGYIEHDLHGPDRSRRKVGGGYIGTEEEIPFWG